MKLYLTGTFTSSRKADVEAYAERQSLAVVREDFGMSWESWTAFSLAPEPRQPGQREFLVRETDRLLGAQVPA